MIASDNGMLSERNTQHYNTVIASLQRVCMLHNGHGTHGAWLTMYAGKGHPPTRKNNRSGEGEGLSYTKKYFHSK